MGNVIDQCKQLPTTCISDAMQGLNHLDPAIKPLKDEYKMVGRAFTVKMPMGENTSVLRAIRDASPGDILVIDAKGDCYRGIAGDFMLGMAQTLGIAGIVVDGAIRDVLGIKALNFPVFCKATTVSASAKTDAGETNVPISCGGVSVHPGDLVVGDVDGVVVIPQRIEQEILNLTLEKMAKDEARAERISGNPDAIKKYLDEVLSKK
ncbi:MULTISPECIES: RraA family protein [unclassified Paenibacillus]|uniref:RraA family protein n=1 Tax=unclassified Paenibacillus TaxID=185978 RepID=UPI001AEA0D94|nr:MULTISPECIES: RraA family protein [unclassified Paenibacillus]MBP1155857.1 RraA family protein [Paenibacillus sp. PvP091]MBP1168757.1 RraA family protein [Paenibacillus sp. PvR098]MBP2439785.1 RraA family protein [Paenibacillus sp. PvP052]